MILSTKGILPPLSHLSPKTATGRLVMMPLASKRMAVVPDNRLARPAPNLTIKQATSRRSRPKRTISQLQPVKPRANSLLSLFLPLLP